ncbi:MAG: tetratricopeptide repeat protein [Bradymonadaceae bacterium]
MDENKEDKEDKENMRSEAMRATPDLVVFQLETTAIEHYQAERLDRAGEFLEKLVEMRPENVDYWALLGVIRRRQGRRIPALEALNQAVELDPTDKNALINLAETLVEAGKVEEGVDLLRAIFEMDYVKGKPAAEQDYFTQRAGAQLAIIKEVLEGTREALNSSGGALGSS